ncbi:SAVED domain-containing protein [Bradyrhizobium sp. RT3a]|uniref:SAVED domain-containing protein n=1 Tax=unclassified Bradyrhizobium TaxID=2631580 RepID=UPI003395FE19
MYTGRVDALSNRPQKTMAHSKRKSGSRIRATAARGKRPKTRHIPEATKILLAVNSGGRCEFRGCNRYLFEHPLTLQGGNFSEHAHIVAFSEFGPRGAEGVRPDDINSPDNLVLLCPTCHKLIDDRPEDYLRAVVEAFKQQHEERIRHVTGLGPDVQTSVVQVKARIAGSAVDIPAPHIYEAVSPRYPVDKRGYVIDLTAYGDEDREEYYRLASQEIARQIARIYDPGMDVERTRHISLFALAPIPLLAFLGSCLSNKIAVEFYQRHRTGDQPWKWKAVGDPALYEIRKRRSGTDQAAVAVIISLSGTVNENSLPEDIDRRFSVYEIVLANQAPNVDFFRQRRDLEEFRITYRNFLSALMKDHPDIEELHVFPAVPSPVAIVCGHDLLPKVHPVLSVYDYDKKSGGFIMGLQVNIRSKSEAP